MDLNILDEFNPVHSLFSPRLRLYNLGLVQGNDSWGSSSYSCSSFIWVYSYHLTICSPFVPLVLYSFSFCYLPYFELIKYFLLFYFSIFELLNYTFFYYYFSGYPSNYNIYSWLLIGPDCFYLFVSVCSIVFHLPGHLMVPMAARALHICISGNRNKRGKGKREHSIKEFSWESLPMTFS